MWADLLAAGGSLWVGVCQSVLGSTGGLCVLGIGLDMKRSVIVVRLDFNKKLEYKGWHVDRKGKHVMQRQPG